MSDAKQDDLELFIESPDSDEVLVEQSSVEESGELNMFPDPDELRGNHNFSRDYVEAGAYLRRRREELKLTIDDVQQETKMTAGHIIAIESGDLDNIPQPAHPVYIVACVKKLGTLYKVDPEILEEITSGLKNQISCQLPDDLSKSCRGHEVNEESLRRQKRLLLILGILGSGILILIIAGITLLVMMFTKPPAITPPFDKKVLLEIQPEPELSITPVPMAKE